MRVTKKLLRKWQACWTAERIDDYFGKRRSVTPKQVAEDATISLDDRLWVLGRCLWHLDPPAARGFAIESALSVAHLAPDEDEHRGILAWLLEIEDLPEDQREAASAAAWSAAYSAAAWSAAYSAASAAWSAADAAYSAARSAADAARSAARSAAWSAESAAYSAAESAESAAYSAAESAAWSAANAAWSAARSAESAAMEDAIRRALEWLGDEAE